MKRLGAVLAAMVGFAFTASGYRPLGKGGYGSAFSVAYGVVASELPMQALGVQFAT
ncbi:hypothetical protein [Mycobacterium tilburgii]|uniref:hypothetical protein n=1 Tax=Mycobacterium tilburgii TaxID=44467 RepID=UPI0016435C80